MLSVVCVSIQVCKWLLETHDTRNINIVLRVRRPSRVADLQDSIDMTMGAYGVIGKAKTPLDDTTMSMKWEVFGWPQKVKQYRILLCAENRAHL